MSTVIKEGVQVKCTRCRNTHFESERISKRDPAYTGIPVFTQVCPCCGCKNFYDLTPQFAWCWASGLIEIGDYPPSPEQDGSGAIMIATGPKYALKGFLDVVARHGKGESAGKLLVPGVPEAPDGAAAIDALTAWLAWCEPRKAAKRDGIKICFGEAS
ncbi:hypothetical protein VSX61_10065 [Brenneria populi subsp. brevivirga]|uniref:hypothetical protein n=1 Tax=Brenneria populi TaxID=1505588 RepID=UPI002E1892D9|nr:hypothetical protein [Brenneria populi subsp. brevivirga]